MMELTYCSALCNISEEHRLHMIGDTGLGFALHGQVQSDPV